MFAKCVKLAILWKDVVAVERKSAAGMIPNSIRLCTLHSKVFWIQSVSPPTMQHTFSSFLKREHAFKTIVECWKKILQQHDEVRVSPSYDWTHSFLKPTASDSILREPSMLKSVELVGAGEKYGSGLTGLSVGEFSDSETRNTLRTNLHSASLPRAQRASVIHSASTRDSSTPRPNENLSLAAFDHPHDVAKDENSHFANQQISTTHANDLVDSASTNVTTVSAHAGSERKSTFVSRPRDSTLRISRDSSSDSPNDSPNDSPHNSPRDFPRDSPLNSLQHQTTAPTFNPSASFNSVNELIKSVSAKNRLRQHRKRSSVSVGPGYSKFSGHGRSNSKKYFPVN